MFHLFPTGTTEWLYFNVCIFVYARDGWFHPMSHIEYLKKSYTIDSGKTLQFLKEVLGYYLSSEEYSGAVSCNLIRAFSELHVNESIVTPLFNLSFKIIDRRLPYRPDTAINSSLYGGLKNFTNDELVVALLIARLKTLTIEKTQGIIWALLYISKTAPCTLFKPYIWAFSNCNFLLSIHRAVLLQILKENVELQKIPDELTCVLIQNFPTGFFLEDQYIRYFCNYQIEFDNEPVIPLQWLPDSKDDWFFPVMHEKYAQFFMTFGILQGSYNEYQYQRKKINEDHEEYCIRSEKMMVPITSLADAAYKIVNTQGYSVLKAYTEIFCPESTCSLRFFLDEIALQVGSRTRRPDCLSFPSQFPEQEKITDVKHFTKDGWIIIASKETELYGEHFKEKKQLQSSITLTFDEPNNSTDSKYSKYTFHTGQYFDQASPNMSIDKPICELSIYDILEKSNIIFVSPFIIKELNLKVDPFFVSGLQARTDDGVIVIKMINWKEDYFGSISDGLEVPRQEGTAVIIREDYFWKLITLYSNQCFLYLSKT